MTSLAQMINWAGIPQTCSTFNRFCKLAICVVYLTRATMAIPLLGLTNVNTRQLSRRGWTMFWLTSLGAVYGLMFRSITYLGTNRTTMQSCSKALCAGIGEIEGVTGYLDSNSCGSRAKRSVQRLLLRLGANPLCLSLTKSTQFVGLWTRGANRNLGISPNKLRKQSSFFRTFKGVSKQLKLLRQLDKLKLVWILYLFKKKFSGARDLERHGSNRGIRTLVSSIRKHPSVGKRIL